jgi:formate dehydrogenase maturation protein FdhE
MPRKVLRRRLSEKKKKTVCPECGSSKVVPIVNANSEEWEARPEWHCDECSCDWRGEWRRFKRANNFGTRKT